MQIVALLVIGLGIGVVGGMIGIGGGVLLIPALTELFGYSHRTAAALTLAAMVPPVTLPGVIQYYNLGHLKSWDLILAGCIAVAFSIGAFAGATLQEGVPENHLRFSFGLLMVYVAMRLLYRSDSEAEAALAGVIATGFAWVSFVFFRALGRKHLARPILGDTIRQKAESERGPDDYYI